MKHLIKTFFFLTFLTFHVIGQDSLKKNKENTRTPNLKSPYCLDMTIVPGGDFTLNSYKMKHLSDDTTLLYANGNVWGRESVASFYISDHEVTNAEYREFVNWVRDSIARSKLFIRVSGEEKKMWGKYTNTVSENIDNRTGQYFVLNWDTKLDYSSAEIAFLLSDMYFSNDDQFYIRKQFDNRLINYTYTDLGTNQKIRLNPYPDTLCWVTNFKYYGLEDMTNSYFWHTAYDNYPVVGVTWNQAIAYCDWRTKCYNEELNKMNARKKAKFVNVKFTLPNSSQWSYASGEDESIHDLTDLPHMRNKQGCYTSNFGCIYLNSDIYVKGYRDDGAFLTANVKSYTSNIFGLYNMFGNVSEWTNDHPTAKPDNFFRNLVNTCSLVNDSIPGATQLYITDPYTKTTKLVKIGSSEHKKMIEQRLQFYNISPDASLEDILKNYIAFNSVDSALRDTILWIVDNALDSSWRVQFQTTPKEQKIELPDGVVEGVIIREERVVSPDETPLYLYNNEFGMLEVFDKEYAEEVLEIKIRELKQNWQVIERAERKQIPFDGNAIDHCHIVQGGSWASQPNYLYASCKEVYHESESSCKIGFRVVMDAPIIEENGICKNCTSKERKKMRKIQKSLNR
jgi:formylglycine-generating enzyme required for sulfatase activity